MRNFRLPRVGNHEEKSKGEQRGTSRGGVITRPDAGESGKKQVKSIDILKVELRASFWVRLSSLKCRLGMLKWVFYHDFVPGQNDSDIGGCLH